MFVRSKSHVIGAYKPFFCRVSRFLRGGKMFYFFEELTAELSITECIIFSLIHSIYYRNLQEGEERCFFASNNYIAERLGLSKRTVITALQKLKELGYIEVNYHEDENRVVNRTIVPRLIDLKQEMDFRQKQENFAGGVVKNSHGGSENSARGVVKKLHPINKYIDNNNINIDICTKEQDFAKGGADAPVSASADEPEPRAPEFTIDPKERWNGIAKRFGLPQVILLSKQRIQKLKARIKTAGSEEAFWRMIEQAVASSAFLRGETRDWRASLDFFLQESSFIKASEGTYDRQEKQREPTLAEQNARVLAEFRRAHGGE